MVAGRRRGAAMRCRGEVLCRDVRCSTIHSTLTSDMVEKAGGSVVHPGAGHCTIMGSGAGHCTMVGSGAGHCTIIGSGAGHWTMATF